MPDGATVFQAEVAAVGRAAETLVHMRPDCMKFVKIFVDSQAAISAIGNPFIASEEVYNTVDRLNMLSKMVKSLTIVWIPAHKGHKGNERADVLAKEGSGEQGPENQLRVLRPLATVKAQIRENIMKEWQGEWSRSSLANHSKSFLSGPNPPKARFVYKLARLELGRLIRIITGHNNLFFFQTKIGLYNNPMCRFCGDGHETITHIMSTCPRFRRESQDAFLDVLPGLDMKWSVRDLLNFSYNPGINEAFEGTWASGDPIPDDLGLNWLDRGSGDENNNCTTDESME